jgi:hypothetical protein
VLKIGALGDLEGVAFPALPLEDLLELHGDLLVLPE